MKCKYRGMNKTYNNRVAVIELNNEFEQQVVYEVAHRIKEYGYNFDNLIYGVSYVEVDNYEDYKNFMFIFKKLRKDVISELKSSLNSTYGEHAVKQTIDAKNDMVRTELTGYHVSGVITETGTLMLSCDIYAQDLDIKESYLAYNVGSGYAVYDEISLTRVAIYPHAEAVRQFFTIRVNALEVETIKTLY